jgi:rhomboid protease GluP
MYSLYVLGGQMETFLGRTKFLFVFFISGICGGLLSSAINLIKGKAILAVGASGAIFGLLGSITYFSYYY